MTDKFELFKEKMKKENLPELIINNFNFYFKQLLNGEKGELSEKSIDKIDKLPIDKIIKPQIVFFDMEENAYIFTILNKESFEQFLESQNVDAMLKKELLDLYKSAMKSDTEIKKLINETTDIGEKLMNTWDETRICNMTLTSVGIAIAATHFEQITGEEVDIEIWIN